LEGVGSYADLSIPYPNLAIDSAYFPGTVYWYWSSLPDALSSLNAWFVYFNYGFSGNGSLRSVGYAVRLVRGGQ